MIATPPGFEPTTCRSQVRHSTPLHCQCTLSQSDSFCG